MSNEVPPDGIHHDFVARKRDLIVQRLSRALEAIDRKRHAAQAVAADVVSLLPGHKSSEEAGASTAMAAPKDDRVRSAVLGAAAGGAVMALGLYLEHRRRERNKPLKVIQRAWFKYAMPPQPSLFKRLVVDAVGSLLMSVASEAARAGVQKVLELQAANAEDEGPVVIDRTSDVPDPSFVTEPLTVDPGIVHPREAAVLPPSGIAPPDPIAPMPSPLREFT